jgi:hypothetical protein
MFKSAMDDEEDQQSELPYVDIQTAWFHIPTGWADYAKSMDFQRKITENL